MVKIALIALIISVNLYGAEVKVRAENKVNQQAPAVATAAAVQFTPGANYAQEYLRPYMPNEVIDLVLGYANAYSVQHIIKLDSKAVGFQTVNDLLITCSQSGVIRFFHGGKSVKMAIPAIAKNANYFKRLNNGDLAIGTDDGKVIILNEGCAEKQTLSEHNNYISGIVQMPDGNLITTSSDCHIVLWKKENDAYKLQFKVKKHEHAISCLLKVNDKLLITGGNDGRVVIWNYDNGKLIYQQTIVRHLSGNEPNHVLSLISITDSIIASGLTDQTIRIYHLQDGKDRSRDIGIQTNDWPASLCMLNDGTLVASSPSGALKSFNSKGEFNCEVKISDDWIHSIKQIDDYSIAIATGDNIVILSNATKLLLQPK